MEDYMKNRDFLRADAWDEMAGFESDQNKGLAVPPLQKEVLPDQEIIELCGRDEFAKKVDSINVLDAIDRRRSRRRFTIENLSLTELSYLLWATQGIQRIVRDGVASFRTSPSAGARHSFETYIIADKIEGLARGLYRYQPAEHALCRLSEGDMINDAASACCGQSWMSQAAAVFFWTTIPYRTEWRYGPAAAKVIAIDAGHVCQNLYLACEAIGAGTCGIGAYLQKEVDKLVGVDGKDEFVIYAAPVGKIR